MSYKKVGVNELSLNPFVKIGKEWMLISAEKDGKVNTMTASWGMMGVFWGKNVVTVGIRPQRYTKEFVDAGDIFTLTFFDGEQKEALTHLGTVSGRDEDKISTVGFHVTKVGDAPTFEEGKLVLVCKKLMQTPLDPKEFLEDWIDTKWYPEKDYHMMYTAEIVDAYYQ